MAITNSRSIARPAKDEWGVYDPQQAGLAALFARLDSRDGKPAVDAPIKNTEIAEAAPARPTLRETQ
jgi:hypothetical protein